MQAARSGQPHGVLVSKAPSTTISHDINIRIKVSI
jgi:hypothetical protein